MSSEKRGGLTGKWWEEARAIMERQGKNGGDGERQQEGNGYEREKETNTETESETHANLLAHKEERDRTGNLRNEL